MGMPFFVTVHGLRPLTVTQNGGDAWAMPPLAIDFQNKQIENKPPVLHRGKLTFNLATIE